MCYFFNLDVCFFFVKDPVKLIPGAMIEIMVEGQLKSEKEAPFWVPAQLLSLVRMQFLFFLAIRSDC
jgi:hypothetical protein